MFAQGDHREADAYQRVPTNISALNTNRTHLFRTNGMCTQAADVEVVMLTQPP